MAGQKTQLTRMKIAKVMAELRATFKREVTLSLTWRVKQLQALDRLLAENRDVIEQAVKTDLGKPVIETRITETALIHSEINGTLKKLKTWMKPKKASLPLFLRPAKGRVTPEPYGVVLIIAPWNYPVSLLLIPLIGALAAGNTVLLKPSEVTPTVAQILTRLIPLYLDPDAIQILPANQNETTSILAERFDYIFYTGSPAVGKIIAAAAARFLTPVTLELGGKSPVWVSPRANLKVAAERLAWGKFTNAGQTCVAPDYVLTTKEAAPKLIAEVSKAVTKMYGEKPQKSRDYGRIVNERHFNRLTGYLKDRAPGEIKVGGIVDARKLYIAPTVLAPVSPSDPIMQEEIFGPILPIVEVNDFTEALKFIRAREKPLALYAFTYDAYEKKQLAATPSGAVCFNVPLVHLMAPELPFGGVGMSGYGAYHGYYSFATFSHFKPILSKPFAVNTLKWVYPPYGYMHKWLLRWLSR